MHKKIDISLIQDLGCVLDHMLNQIEQDETLVYELYNNEKHMANLISVKNYEENFIARCVDTLP